MPPFFRRTLAACALSTAIVAASGSALAQAQLIGNLGGPSGYGTNCLSPNDDGSSAAVDVRAAFPGGLHFFTGMYTSLFVNTNGNITFNAALPTYTPQAFPVSQQPMIAPYWADVDIRPNTPDGTCGGLPNGFGPGDGTCQNPESDGVWWFLERGRMVVTWYKVGYYRCHDDKLMSFQLVLTDASACGAPGDFDVEFRYNECSWTTGDASQGMGGFGGTPAQAGFDAGDTVHFTAIQGSLTPTINTQLCGMSNVFQPGIWRFQIRNGDVNTDAGVQTCGVGACRRVVPICNNGVPVTCVPGDPTAEQCDGMDHNCNGLVDEGTQTCGVGACQRTAPLCAQGHMATCTPGSPGNEVCNDGIDNNCDGRVDENCGPDVVMPDATDVVSECHDARCYPNTRLEGRAGPAGNCGCVVAGHSARRAQWQLVAALVAMGIAVRRRRARRRN